LVRERACPVFRFRLFRTQCIHLCLFVYVCESAAINFGQNFILLILTERDPRTLKFGKVFLRLKRR